MRKTSEPRPRGPGAGARGSALLERLEDPVVLGKVGRPHGLAGLCRVQPFGDEETVLFDAERLWVEMGPPEEPRRWRALRVESVAPHKQLLLVGFEEITSAREAEALTNRALAVPRHLLPEPEEGEYYWRDLIGLRVFDEASGGDLGVVEGLMPLPGADNLIIRAPEGDEWMLPFLDDAVVDVDLPAGRMRVRVPPGLRDADA